MANMLGLQSLDASWCILMPQSLGGSRILLVSGRLVTSTDCNSELCPVSVPFQLDRLTHGIIFFRFDARWWNWGPPPGEHQIWCSAKQQRRRQLPWCMEGWKDRKTLWIPMDHRFTTEYMFIILTILTYFTYIFYHVTSCYLHVLSYYLHILSYFNSLVDQVLYPNSSEGSQICKTTSHRKNWNHISDKEYITKGRVEETNFLQLGHVLHRLQRLYGNVWVREVHGSALTLALSASCLWFCTADIYYSIVWYSMV